MIGIDIQTTGPLFAGAMAAGKNDMIADVVEAVTKEAKRVEVQIDQASFRRPTPYYWTQVRDVYPAFLVGVVDDTDIVYGPWLEGTSRANARSSFKGYHMWQRTTADVDGRAVSIAADAVEKFCRRLEA